MVCTGTKLYQFLQIPKQSLKQVVRHASISILSTRPNNVQRSRINNLCHHWSRRNKHCSRIDACAEKKKKDEAEEAELRRKEKTLWGMLFGVRRKKPRIHTCRRLQAMEQWEEEKIPEFIIEMCKGLPEGSAIYKTQGHAFLVEVPCKVPQERKKTREEILLAKLERDKRARILEDENNPMPTSHPNPSLRWIDLNNRCLHPLYKKMEIACPISRRAYEYAQGPVNKPPSFLWDHHRYKANFSDFKMGVLPRYLELQEKETMVNKNSSLDTKKDLFKPCKFRPCPMTECHLDCERWKPKNILKKKL